VSFSCFKVGDLVYVEKKQRVPADMILLKTTEPGGSCFLRTDQVIIEQFLSSGRILMSVTTLAWRRDRLEDEGNDCWHSGRFSCKLPTTLDLILHQLFVEPYWRRWWSAYFRRSPYQSWVSHKWNSSIYWVRLQKLLISFREWSICQSDFGVAH